MELLVSVSVDAENPIAGDLQLRNGSLVWSTDTVAEVTQRLRSRLRFFKGEWFLDRRQGMPYFQTIFQRASDATIRALFSRAIRETPGVAALDSLSIVRDRAARSLSVSFKCQLTDGALVSVGPFLVDV